MFSYMICQRDQSFIHTTKDLRLLHLEMRKESCFFYLERTTTGRISKFDPAVDDWLAYTLVTCYK